MKNILLTRKDDFLGFHLVAKLMKKGYKVRVFCLYNSSSIWGWLDHLSIDAKIEINVFLLHKKLTKWYTNYPISELFKKGLSKTIKWFSNKEDISIYKTVI